MTRWGPADDEEPQEVVARVAGRSDAQRRMLERALHDGVHQHLTLLSVRLAMLRELTGEGEAGALADEIRSDLNHALEDLRILAHEIYPSVLEHGGLAIALGRTADRMTPPARVDIDDRRYAAAIEAIVYFCCLEAMDNASRHAGAGAQVTVRAAEEGGELVFAVSDDGLGFDPSTVDDDGGLQHVADRLDAVGGMLEVESAPGQGTVVRGTVSLVWT